MWWVSAAHWSDLIIQIFLNWHIGSRPNHKSGVSPEEGYNPLAHIRACSVYGRVRRGSVGPVLTAMGKTTTEIGRMLHRISCPHPDHNANMTLQLSYCRPEGTSRQPGVLGVSLRLLETAPERTAPRKRSSRLIYGHLQWLQQDFKSWTGSLASYLTPNGCLRIYLLIVPLEFMGQESEIQIELNCYANFWRIAMLFCSNLRSARVSAASVCDV